MKDRIKAAFVVVAYPRIYRNQLRRTNMFLFIYWSFVFERRSNIDVWVSLYPYNSIEGVLFPFKIR